MDMASLSLCPRISLSTRHSQAGSSTLAVQRFSMGGLGSGSERFSRLRSSGKLIRLSQASQKFRNRRLAMPRTSTPETCKEKLTYIPGPLDVIFLNVFRSKMVEEVGWDSSRPGYDGLIDVAKRLLLHYPSRQETEQATVRVLRSLFPSWLLTLFKQLIAPLGDGKLGAVLCARVTQATTQWLMGPCQLNEVQLSDGSLLLSGVMIQKCKYLDGTKCAGICIHTCKLPTQAFITGDMGVALLMEPNYEDFSCQFKFGVEALPAALDPALQTGCLSMCPTAASRSSLKQTINETQCPQVTGP
ncbi:unnamed protein product [Sphagnum compactum]